MIMMISEVPGSIPAVADLGVCGSVIVSHFHNSRAICLLSDQSNVMLCCLILSDIKRNIFDDIVGSSVGTVDTR